jgi:hypothetical protein
MTHANILINHLSGGLVIGNLLPLALFYSCAVPHEKLQRLWSAVMP